MLRSERGDWKVLSSDGNSLVAYSTSSPSVIYPSRSFQAGVFCLYGKFKKKECVRREILFYA